RRDGARGRAGGGRSWATPVLPAAVAAATMRRHMSLKEAVMSAAGRADVRDAVWRIYAELQREIELRKPVCTTSGRCCRFEHFGHRLYVTTAELAVFVHGLGEEKESGAALRSARGVEGGEWDGRGCPFQVDGLCGVHPVR